MNTDNLPAGINCPKSEKVGIYLKLFHGAKNKEELRSLSEYGVWGIEGPEIGPLKFVHITYSSHIKFEFKEVADANGWEKYIHLYGTVIDGVRKDVSGELFIDSDGLVVFKDMVFADYSIFSK